MHCLAWLHPLHSTALRPNIFYLFPHSLTLIMLRLLNINKIYLLFISAKFYFQQLWKNMKILNVPNNRQYSHTIHTHTSTHTHVFMFVSLFKTQRLMTSRLAANFQVEVLFVPQLPK